MIDVDQIDEVLEECFWVTVLILFATSKRGRKPRLDFYTMHFVTSAMFLPTFVAFLREGEDANPRFVVDLLRTWLYLAGIWLIDRGRPRIDARLVMESTDHPSPPHSEPEATGEIEADENGDIWSKMVDDALHHRDAHVPKTMRALVYAHKKYGGRKAGQIPGIWKNSNLKGGETWLEGLDSLDGTVFVRCAGVLMDRMGWVTYGQEAGVWDRSGLGWEEAWA